VALDGWGKSFSESEVEANGYAYGEVSVVMFDYNEV